MVVENRTGRPLARAKVTLELIQGAAVGPVATSLTDSGGRFWFASLKAGAYLVRAARSGYLTAKYGQTRWNGSGVPIMLEAGSQFFAELRARRPGVITGEVYDENRIGLPGQPVYAFRAGARPLKFAATGVSDDRGVYRIPGLEPGSYWVRTGPRQLDDGRRVLPTFAGGSTSLEQARSLEVQVDNETTAPGIEPVTGRLADIEVHLAGGAPAEVTLYTEMGKLQAPLEPGGSHLFDQLAPGAYSILAIASAGAPRAAYMRAVAGEGITRLSVQLGPMPVLRVHCEEKGRRIGQPERVSVILYRKEPPESQPIRALGGESVTLPPGEWLAAVAAPANFYLEAVGKGRAAKRLGANEFSLETGETADFIVSLSSRPASLRGRVVTRDGQTAIGASIFLDAVDPELRSRLAGLRTARLDHQGNYRFAGLPPGKYRIFSSYEIQEPSAADWETLRVQTVTLAEGEAADLDLELLGSL